MEEVLALAFETGCTIWHNTLSLGGSDFSAKVGFARFAEFTFFTFWGAGGMLVMK